jgi:hypothetical protein
MSDYKIELRPTIPDHLGGKIVVVLMGLLFMGIGLWAIHTALAGRTPNGSMELRSIPGSLALGGLFVWGGLQPIILALGGNKLPRLVHVVLISVFLLCLAVPFLLVGILTPDQITSSTSVKGIVLSESKGGSSGQLVFVGVGTLLLVAIPFLARRLMAKKQVAETVRHHRAAT